MREREGAERLLINLFYDAPLGRLPTTGEYTGFTKSSKDKEKLLKVKSLTSADVKRRNTLVKKRGLLGAALVLSATIVMTACSDSSSDGNSPSPTKGKGVLGQISGVVLDGSTGLPLKGATVEIAGKKATTDELGYYMIDNVIPNVAGNKYSVSFFKNGYAAEQREAEKVDASEYVTQDPFLEAAVLTNLKELFLAWVQNTHPNIAGNNTLTTWTYSNGVYVNGEGATVQVTSGDGTPNFELVKGLDYTYKFGQSLATISLKPLTASLKGKISLYTVDASDAVPLPQAGVKIQFKDSADTKYGTGETKADGTFEVKGLPVYTDDLSLVIAGFVEGDAYYNGLTAQLLDGEKFVPAAFSTVKEASDVWNIYLQGKTDAAYIVDVSAGERGAPIAPTAHITITFSKAIDTKTFIAKIDGMSGNAKGVGASEKLTFDAAWDVDKKIATLTPREKLSSYATATLPYAKDNSASIGTLGIYAKAADGSDILDPENPTIDITETAPFTTAVYTAEGIKLVEVEIIANPTGNAARAILPVGGALKLAFNKEVAPLAGDTFFKIGTVDAAYKVDAADAKVVYVYADKPIASDSSLTYKVYAKDDTFNDTTTQAAVTVSGLSGGVYEPVIVKNPYLGKTTPQDEYNASQLSTNVVIGGANNGWDRTKEIKIEFTDVVSAISSLIPTATADRADLYYKEGGAVYRVTAKGTDSYAPTTTTAGNVLTIALPTALALAGGKTFYPAFTFTVNSKAYKIGPKAIYPDAVEEVQITIAPETTADLDVAGVNIAAVNASIFGVYGSSAVAATTRAFTANTAAEDFKQRSLIGYVKSTSNPVWTALSNANLPVGPLVSDGSSIPVPAFNLGTTPAYKNNNVEVKWRGVSSTGRIIETAARKIVFTRAKPSITWANSFAEAPANNGSVTGAVTATANGWKFASAGPLTQGVHYTVNNLPAGLTPVISVDAARTIATVSLSGNAASHAPTNSVNNLTVTFDTAAFETVTSFGYGAGDGALTADMITDYSNNNISVTFN